MRQMGQSSSWSPLAPFVMICHHSPLHRAYTHPSVYMTREDVRVAVMLQQKQGQICKVLLILCSVLICTSSSFLALGQSLGEKWLCCDTDLY